MCGWLHGRIGLAGSDGERLVGGMGAGVCGWLAGWAWLAGCLCLELVAVC